LQFYDNFYIKFSKIFHFIINIYFQFLNLQEDANRGKPNWEHLADDLHVLITVEDTDNRAKLKLQRAVDEVQKLLIPVSIFPLKFIEFPTENPIEKLFKNFHLFQTYQKFLEEG
jgi:hypothetical protein